MASLRGPLLVSAGAAVLVGLGAVAYILLSPPPAETETLDNVLTRNGYLEMRPASRFGGPGTFTTIDKITSSYIMFSPTCVQPVDELEKTWNESPTLDTNLTEQLHGTFDAGINLVKKLNQNLGGKLVRTIKIRLENARIIIIPDQIVYSLREKYLRDDCEKTIIRLTKLGARVCQTSSSLMADLVYSIEYDDSVNEDVKGKLTDKIAVDASFGGKRSGSNTLSGEKLFIGIKLSQECIVDPNSAAVTIQKIAAQGGRREGGSLVLEQ